MTTVAKKRQRYWFEDEQEPLLTAEDVAAMGVECFDGEKWRFVAGHAEAPICVERAGSPSQGPS